MDLTGSNKTPTGKTAVALGLFDGVHIGHREVINRAVELSVGIIEPAVFTFISSTITTKGNGTLEYILTHDLKMRYIKQLGVKYIYTPDFLNFKSLSAENFVKMVIKDKLRAKYVVCGEDFKFGSGATSGTTELEYLCNKYNIEVVKVVPVKNDKYPISSTRIRNYLKEGKIEKANELLGYSFCIRQVVSHGNEIGRTIQFPTINQYLHKNQVTPKFGVYISNTIIEGEVWLSITNVGVKPTIGKETMPIAETHILGYGGNLYNKVVTVSLLKYLRSEQKFNSIDELRKVISDDVQSTYAYRDNEN